MVQGVHQNTSSSHWMSEGSSRVSMSRVAQKVEAVDESPLGEKQDADAIAAKWQDVEMPD